MSTKINKQQNLRKSQIEKEEKEIEAKLHHVHLLKEEEKIDEEKEGTVIISYFDLIS